MIESLLESKKWASSSQTGTISAVAGAKAIVGIGTTFTNHSPGDIIEYTDDTSIVRYGEIDTITDNLNLDLKENAPAAASGVAYAVIDLAAQTVPFFIGDNTVLKKSIEKVPTAAASILFAANSLSKISKDEGLALKSFYIRLPYQYTFADESSYLFFRYLDAAGNILSTVDTVGESANIMVPIENIEVPMNVLIPAPSAAGITLPTDTWQLSVNMQLGAISQVDAPDVLNGQYLPIFAGVRIIHAATALIG